MVPLTRSHINTRDALYTSSTQTCKKIILGGLHELQYVDLSLVDRRYCKNITTSLAFCNLAPWPFNCFLRRNLLITTLAPSQGPFPWPILKKIQPILQPPVILDTIIQSTMVYYSWIGMHNHHSTPLMPLWGNMSIVYHVLPMQFKTMLNFFLIILSIIKNVEMIFN